MGIKWHLAMTGEEIGLFTGIPENAAWMFCPFSDETEYGPPGKSLLVLTDAVAPDSESAEIWIEQLRQLEPKAVLLDFQRKPDGKGQAFSKALCRALACPVIPSVFYTDQVDGSVFLPPVPLHSSLAAHIAPWKGREIWLDISGEGERITLTEFGAAIEVLPVIRAPGSGHREKKLHCHYSISLEEDAAVFTLWRTEADVMDLLQEAQTLGIRNAIGLYQEWKESSIAEFR